jgi:preprotein translocase SecE subunit
LESSLETKDDNKPKRTLKNPETFRERAIKANETSDKPERPHRIRKFFAAIFSPIGKFFARLKKIKALKPLFAAFRIIGRIIWPKYFRTSFHELKKVTWPTWKISLRLTYAVIVFAVIFGISVAFVDWGLGKIFKHLLLK